MLKAFLDIKANAFCGEEAGCDSPVEESGSCGLHDYCSRRVLTPIEEPEFPLLDYYPRKPVAIGPDHQAYVPIWKSEHLNSPLSSKKMDVVIEEDDQRKMGSCIIQMPDVESDSYHDKNIGRSRVYCTCLDQGSARCVRQHIAEEEGKLKSFLGQNILMELGFDEMGEDVARGWSIDEINVRQNMVLEHKKRPFCEDEACQLTSKKHAGQLECNNRLPLFEEIIQFSNLPHELFDSGVKWPLRCEDNNLLLADTFNGSVVPAGRVSQNKGVHDIFSSSLSPATDKFGVSSNQVNAFCGEEAGCDSPVEESGSCGLHDYCSRRVLTPIEEPEFPLLDYYPRKPVAIGPDHQAYVPIWKSEHLNSPLSSKKMDVVIEEDDQRKMGSCIIQMPDVESDSYHDKNIGRSRVYCTCLDQGSARCVRQHIAEEEGKLKSFLGQNILMELGFDEMGEDVARGWSIDEINLFQEVVYSNPLSMGKKFWAELPLAFPTRSNKELVSYYFNVFMLGKRGLQNRWESCDADSDNDEWQGGDYNELAASEEDEDSVMESEAVDHDGLTSDYHVRENEEECDDDDDDDDDDDGEEDGIEGNEKWEEEDEEEAVISGELDAQNCFTNSPDTGCNSGLDVHLDEANHGTCTDAQGMHDESSVPCECCRNGNDFQSAIGTSAVPCPGSEATFRTQGNIVEARTCGNKESSDVFGEGFLSEHPCDSKIWDIGFVSMSGKDVDILPTCSMMKEVFGDEAWNNEVLRDSPRIS